MVAAGLSSGQRLSNTQGSRLLLGVFWGGGGGVLQTVAGKNFLLGLINVAAMFFF